jgi:hypothetical protein
VGQKGKEFLEQELHLQNTWVYVRKVSHLFNSGPVGDAAVKGDWSKIIKSFKQQL